MTKQYNLSGIQGKGNCRNPASVFPDFRVEFYNQNTSSPVHEDIQSPCRTGDKFLGLV
jgi:hypothetical protein